MPRSNRPRRSAQRGRTSSGGSRDDDFLARVRAGHRRVEQRRGLSWTVQPIPAERALKQYRCPGCNRMIEPGTAHIVAWRADHLFGDDHALVDRRHWHSSCWRTA